MAARRELIGAIAERYHSAARMEKTKILDEFVEVTGFHRKHAIRALKKTALEAKSVQTGSRIYNEAAIRTLTVLWEACDRICGKRLKEAVPTLIAAMERHGHLRLDDDVRQLVLKMSAATIDRLLKPVRDVAKQGRRRVTINTPLRKSITVRTFNDWNDPAPGYFEMDMVAHCGKSVAGSHVHSLVMTDIASGWTEAAAMVVREQSLVTLTVEEISRKLPFPVLGLDVDNDSAFINRTVVDYCAAHGIELTRSRAYKKNDQAWIEQKNGSVVRRLVGYGRLEGVTAATVLGELHSIARLYVNYFQPSFKLKSKTRVGAKVSKSYDKPATPYERLIHSDRVSNTCKDVLRRVFESLDPVDLLNRIRATQRKLAQLEVGNAAGPVDQPKPDLGRFVQSLSIAWRDGEVRPTHRKPYSGPRAWRTRVDPFEKVWPLVDQWLNQEPNAAAKEIFQRLQEIGVEQFEAGQLRTLQRRVKQWRTEIAYKLVVGSGTDLNAATAAAVQVETAAY